MPAPPSHILIVDDDVRTCQLLERYLKDNGFSVKTTIDGRRVTEILSTHPIKLIILDLMLPGEDGLSICRRLRHEGEEVPIIMLTAKGDDVDRIVGLEIGAEDYLPKPFNPRELLARIKAVLRRRQPASAPGAPAPNGATLRFGRCELNLASRVFKRAGKTHALTTGEFAVLEAWVTHAGHALSRDKLMELARGKDHGVFDRSMDVQISRLRKLIEEKGAEPRYLQTVWGVGYVFVPDDASP
ncbi:MAG: two-component system response regulator OmpR [Candidatus Synoicihabitans palmerolidicus]|nr:two-component system response regulator OmpR [Candidatus Synoicihabitans palmerolidicus]